MIDWHWSIPAALFGVMLGILLTVWYFTKIGLLR